MPCAKYDEILDSYYTDPPKELLEFKQKNAELYAYLSEHTGAVSFVFWLLEVDFS